MPNILNYLEFRGDLTFKQAELNEIDKIIFARFSYLPFNEIILDKKDSIETIAIKMKDLSLDKFIWKVDKEFIIKLGKTKRFKNLKVTDYKEVLDLQAEKQFAAVTICLPSRIRYISFRGTDMSLVGWKEDFNMSFMKDIPSQKEGVKYLNQIGKKYFGKLIVGGHSKGGNIAIYSAIFCEDKVKRKIKEIINADGPGFDKSIITSENYLKIYERINTYIPQSSIIGRLLEHEGDYEIIHSTEKGLMQHDIFSWQIEGTKLKRIEKLTGESQFVNKVVRDWLQNTTPQQRENFVNIIYDVLISTDAKDFNDFGVDTLKKISAVIKSYKIIEREDRKEIEYMFKLFFESAIKTMKDRKREVKIWNCCLQQVMKTNTNLWKED